MRRRSAKESCRLQAEAAKLLDGRHAFYACAVVGAVEVIEGLPLVGSVKVVGGALHVKEPGLVELLVV